MIAHSYSIVGAYSSTLYITVVSNWLDSDWFQKGALPPIGGDELYMYLPTAQLRPIARYAFYVLKKTYYITLYHIAQASNNSKMAT